MTEFEDTQPAEEGYADDAGYEEGAAATPPDLSDALAQLNERQERLGGYEVEEEPYVDDESYEEQDYDDLDPEQALEAIIEDRVNEAVEPIIEREREQEILALAERYPALREPATLEAVDAELRAMAEAYDDPSLVTDARMAETVLLALAARQQLEQAQAQPQQAQPQGPVLETGAGPGGPRPQQDAVENAYVNAFAGPQTDPWGFPVE
jgi:hypothetical protein